MTSEEGSARAVLPGNEQVVDPASKGCVPVQISEPKTFVDSQSCQGKGADSVETERGKPFVYLGPEL